MVSYDGAKSTAIRGNPGKEPMPTKHTLNLSLTEPLRDFVDELVQAGRFQTGSEVVRTALCLLQDNLQGLVKKHGQRSRRTMRMASGAKEKREPRPAKAHRIKP